MLEALWSVEFESNLGDGETGIIVFKDGKVFGGDSGYIYIGKYDVTLGGNLISDIKIYQIDHPSGFTEPNVAGMDNYNLHVEGKIEEKQIIASGYIVEDTSIKLTLRLTWRADLP